MEVVYKDAAKELTLGECIELYEMGVEIQVNDGKDVTFKTPHRTKK